MSTTSPLYLFSGTSTLKVITRESVGPRRGARSESTSVMVTVRATDQADAERAAGAILSTPPDSGTGRDGTEYRRTYSWDVVTPCDPEPLTTLDVAQVRAQAVRDARAAFYVKHEQPPLLDGATSAEGVGATHATNVCMDFLVQYADDQETTR